MRGPRDVQFPQKAGACIQPVRAMDLTIYWFMFPVGMMVATTAMLSGIGGAAMFAPIFFIIFPLLGPNYPLASPAKRNRVPVSVAAATSVFIVIVTVASASFTQISGLVAAGGINAVPWNLVLYTVPGVIVGGQIGPRLQGRVPPRVMEKAIGILFAVIGIAMVWLVARELKLI